MGERFVGQAVNFMIMPSSGDACTKPMLGKMFRTGVGKRCATRQFVTVTCCKGYGVWGSGCG